MVDLCFCNSLLPVLVLSVNVCVLSPQEQPNQVNYGNICTGLEVLSFLLTVLQSPAILSSFKPLQRGIAACMTCGNTKVLRAVHSLLSRLMSIFPTEPSRWLPSSAFPSGWVGVFGAEDAHSPLRHFIMPFPFIQSFLTKKMWTDFLTALHCYLSALEIQFFICWTQLFPLDIKRGLD